MYKLTVILILFLSILIYSSPDKMLVSTEWLQEHLNDKNLVLLAVGKEEDFIKGHIPGSIHIKMEQFLTDQDGLYSQYPSISKLDSLIESAGINNKSRIIIYSVSGWMTVPARLYLTLESIGYGSQASLLNGSIKTWKEENRSLSAKPAKNNRSSVTTVKKSDVITDYQSILNNLDNPITKIIDARAPVYYDGTEQGEYSRAGHIKGAVNIPYNAVINPDLTFKSEKEIHEAFDKAGIKKGDQLITYCHIGMQASLLYFAAKLIGYDAKLYDGSFEEWSRMENLSVEK